MRFKLVYGEKTRKMVINCLDSAIEGVIIPENTRQHIHFPIPIEMKTIISRDLNDLLTDEMHNRFNVITKEISILQEKRSNIMNELREEMNPKIVEVCEDFKDKYPESFV